MSNPDPLRQALEEALVANPDDLAAHSAYADYLIEQGDVRGELISAQLALEDPSRPSGERKKLKQREEELLEAHEREWLGELAPLLLATPAEERVLCEAESRFGSYIPPEISYSWVRGWLDRLECDHLTVEMTRKLGRAPIARLLHGLVWRTHRRAYEYRYAEGPDVPDLEGHFLPYEVLAHCPAVGNLRVLQLGNEVDPEDWEYNAGTVFGRLAPLVEHMPRLEELYVFAYRNDIDMGMSELRRVFSLSTLSKLRILQHYHGHAYPLEALAANPALARLTHLLCFPHKHARLEPGRPGWSSAISRAGVAAVVRSPHLNSLTHLQLRCCDGGDDMVEDVIASGILKRLRVLDLRHGRVTDKGATFLAARPEGKGLELDLVNNRLTSAGIAALQVAGARVRAEDQQTRPYDTNAIFWGDTE
jgi:uncharacterized protein (TIGR02996 family)